MITMGMDRVNTVERCVSLMIGLLSNDTYCSKVCPDWLRLLLSRLFASLIDAKYSRIQFTPDLLPADVVGTMVYSQAKEQFFGKKRSDFCKFCSCR